MKEDVLSIVEAAYAEAIDVRGWLGQVLAASTTLDGGWGVHGHTYALTGDGGVVTPEHVRGAVEAPGAVVADFGTGEDARRLVASLYTRMPVVGSFSELTGRRRGLSSFDVSRSVASQVSDALGLICGNPDGHGVVLTAPTTSRTRFSAGNRALWVHVAAHVASAYRLVRRPSAEVDAVLSPEGRVHHAEASAREEPSLEALRRETLAMDRARGRMRRASPEEALGIWRGLVAGQWSLVDHVDTDGRRFILAKRNSPEARPWHDLSERERQIVSYAAEGEPHKIIAYALGLSVHGVSTHLKHAARKVGVSSRVGLIREYRASMAGPLGASPT